MDEVTLRKLLDQAYYLGKVYWQQADSESYRANKKAGDTELSFKVLKDEAVALLDNIPKEIPKCCVCGTTEDIHKDGWYGYRCSKDSCVCY